MSDGEAFGIDSCFAPVPRSCKGRGRKTRRASNAIELRSSIPQRLPWSVRSLNPRPTLEFNPKCGLDAHERAPRNWVNTYNLDAFLQEVNPVLPQ